LRGQSNVSQNVYPKFNQQSNMALQNHNNTS
jgi:hypothetical protein